MSLRDLLPAIRELPPGDKLRLIRILAEDLDPTENIWPLEPHKTYVLPTPYQTYGAAQILAEVLDAHSAQDQ